jgi:murein DD-endopeptidase MepM/ murein hydrolase activator NlpD
MTNKSNLLAMSFALALLSACTTTPNQAPVVDRTTPPAVKPATRRNGAGPRDERGLYTVKKGDTLIRIALEFGQNYRDLVAWNNLSNPNDIKVDQVLRVLPPESNGVETAAMVMPPSDKTPPPPPVVKKTGRKATRSRIPKPTWPKCSAPTTARTPLPRRPWPPHGARRAGAAGRASRAAWRRRRQPELDVAGRRQGDRHFRRRQEQGRGHRRQGGPAGRGGRRRKSHVCR